MVSAVRVTGAPPGRRNARGKRHGTPARDARANPGRGYSAYIGTPTVRPAATPIATPTGTPAGTATGAPVGTPAATSVHGCPPDARRPVSRSW